MSHVEDVGEFTRNDADRPFAQRGVERAFVPQSFTDLGHCTQQRRAM
jgi:hypothetical protein